MLVAVLSIAGWRLTRSAWAQRVLPDRQDRNIALAIAVMIYVVGWPLVLVLWPR